jgi:hypothetical protein
MWPVIRLPGCHRRLLRIYFGIWLLARGEFLDHNDVVVAHRRSPSEAPGNLRSMSTITRHDEVEDEEPLDGMTCLNPPAVAQDLIVS